MPVLEDDVGRWFLNFYYQIKNLSGFEYHITIQDFHCYFDIYPVPFQKYIIISITKGIEKKVYKFNKKLEEAKKTNNVK